MNYIPGLVSFSAAFSSGVSATANEWTWAAVFAVFFCLTRLKVRSVPNEE